MARLRDSLRATSSMVSPFGFSVSSSRIRPISSVPRSVDPSYLIAVAEYIALLPSNFTRLFQSSQHDIFMTHCTQTPFHRFHGELYWAPPRSRRGFSKMDKTVLSDSSSVMPDQINSDASECLIAPSVVTEGAARALVMYQRLLESGFFCAQAMNGA